MKISRAFASISLATSLVLGACDTPESPSLLVSGVLLGNDGAAMHAAHVQLITPVEYWSPGTQAPLQSVQAGPDGGFALNHHETGVYFLRFTGVDHVWKAIPIVVDSSLGLRLSVRLALPDYVKDLGSVRVIGDFNDFDPRRGLQLEARDDGRFGLQILSDADTLAYQLAGLDTGHQSEPLNAPGTERIAFDGHFGYASVVDVRDGIAEVFFDPSRLPYPDGPPELTFSDPTSRSATLASVWSHQEQVWEGFTAAMDAAVQAEGEPVYDSSPTLKELVDELNRKPDSSRVEALFFGVLDCSFMGADLDPALADAALRSVGPTSRLWSLLPSTPTFPSNMKDIIGAAVYDRGAAEAFDSSRWLDEVLDFVEQASSNHPDPGVRAEMLLAGVWAAQRAEEEELAGEFLERLYSVYPDSEAARWARMYSPDRTIQAGNAVPDFSFPALDPTGNSIYRDSLLGTVYLLDFWATWCAPCLLELPDLHEVFEQFSPKGFRVVSISFDQRAEDVSALRTARFPMPWIHAHLPDGFGTPAAELFELTGIPMVVLVDESGRIIGTGSAVTGNNLKEVLTNHFASR